MAGRGAWRQSRHRRLPRLCSDAVPHRLAMRRRFLLLPCPSGRRWRRRRHRTCMHRRARWRAPPWGTQKRTRHRRITTESSTSGGFHRRRRRRCRLRGRHAAGRGTTLGAGCAAQRAASAPSPPHLHSTRARSAPSCCGHELARLRVRAQLLRSARASRRAAKGAGRSMANGEMVGEQRRLEPAAAGRGDARVRACARSKKKVGGRTEDGGPSQYPERLLRSPYAHKMPCTMHASMHSAPLRNKSDALRSSARSGYLIWRLRHAVSRPCDAICAVLEPSAVLCVVHCGRCCSHTSGSATS
jgi:hypothetical protein